MKDDKFVRTEYYYYYLFFLPICLLDCFTYKIRKGEQMYG